MGKVTAYQAGVVAFVALGAFTYGFAFAVFVTSIGQPGFYAYFNLDSTSSYTASIIGAVNSLFAAGAAAGAIIQGWVGDWLGRKKAIIISQLFCVGGGALCAGSVNIAMLVSCRFFQGIGLGQSITLVSVYLTEVAHKNNRGLLSGLTACSLASGYVVCSWVGFAAFFSSNQVLQWRLPLALACVSPLITLSGIYWIPESPRYLVWAERKEEAWTVLRRLHHDASDPEELSAHAEFQQIVLQVDYDKQQNTGYIQMFRKPTWRGRSLLVIFLLFATQATGILGIGNFQVLIYNSLGITGYMALLFYCMYALIGTIPNFFCAYFMDRIGRRRLLLMGYVAVTLLLIVEMLLQKQYIGTTSKAGNAAAVAMLWIWVGLYGFFLDPPQFVYCAEIFPTTLRAKGIALGFAAYFVGAITFTTPSATAFNNIGWKMYLVYIACNCVTVVVIYFFVPETSNLSLEEIGELFGDKVVVHLTADGHGIVEEEEVKQIEAEKSVHERIERIEV
ncbi:general substrate transporter [Rhizodiscina lignyota]|uniref:General substrate transporter n=1 Tax=Rhizodiscina lignyota TaxID=1504668 RepID=A0A9P4ILT2_9PEZI|nr:general substrate transporter [Rhizodiscina lignyota]